MKYIGILNKYQDQIKKKLFPIQQIVKALNEIIKLIEKSSTTKKKNQKAKQDFTKSKGISATTHSKTNRKGDNSKNHNYIMFSQTKL